MYSFKFTCTDYACTVHVNVFVLIDTPLFPLYIVGNITFSYLYSSQFHTGFIDSSKLKSIINTLQLNCKDNTPFFKVYLFKQEMIFPNT